MKKKLLFILSFVFALIFVLSLTDKPSADLPGFLTAEAAVTAQGSCTDTITWTLDGSTLTISGSGEMPDYSSEFEVPWNNFKREILTLNLGDGITSVGNYAFYRCAFLRNVYLPDGILSVGKLAFGQCTYLSSVTLPDSVKVIKELAFSECINLSSFRLPADIERIEPQAFYRCINLTEFTSDGGNGFYRVEDGIVYSDDMTQLVVYPCNKADTSYTIPDSVLTVCDYAAYGSKNITVLVMGKNVTSIGKNSFAYNESIESIVFSDKLTFIGESAFFSDSKLKEVILPEGLSELSDSAFSNCDLLEKVYIPSTVTQIGEACFSYCISLTEADISEGLVRIGVSAFECCYALRDIKFPESLNTIESNAFINCDSLETIHLPAALGNLTYNPFSDCDNLVSITVDENNAVFSSVGGVLYNKAGTFLYAYPAAKPDTVFVVAENITYLASSAFRGVRYLEDVYILGKIYRIHSFLFYNASALQNVYLSPGARIIDSCSFAKCPSLEYVYIPDGVEEISNQAFLNSTALTEIVLPASVTHITESAFAGCTALESVTVLNPECAFESAYAGMPENTVIKGYKGSTAEAYAGTDGLTFLPVTASGSFSDNCLWVLDENGLLEISGDGEMTGFTSLAAVPWKDYKADIKTVEIKNGVTSIGAYAFYQHTALDTVVLPEAVTHIDSFAFFDCTALKNINTSACTALESIGSNVFNGCTALKSITLPESLSTIGENTFLRCMALEEIKVDENNDVYYSDGGVLFEKRGDEINLVCYPVSRPGAKYTVDGKVTGIAPAAFAYCDIIEEVKFPANSSLKYIGAAAFYECSALRSFTVPKNVERIDGNVFSMCFSLENIFASFSNKNYCAFDGVLFNADMTSVIAYPAGNERRVYVIPATVQIIEKESFSHCPNLEEILFEEGSELTVIKESAFYSSERLSLVSIPDGLKTIEDYAFMNCEALRYVYIPENTAAVGSYVFSGCVSLEAVVALSRECTFGQLADSGASAVYYAYENTAAAEQLEKQGQVVYIFEVPDGAFEYSDMILTIYDLSGVPAGDDPFRYPWARYSGSTAVIILKNTGNIGAGLFGGFTEVTVIIAENSDGVVIEKNAFTGCDSLKTVISFADITVEGGAFGENDNISFFAQEGRDYQGEAEAARFSFSDGTVSFSGKALSLNSHDFLDLVTAVCYGYNDKEVRIIEFAALETVGFAFDSDFDDSNPELRVSYEDIKVVATVSYDGEVFEEITFNEFCSNAANDEWVLLRLSLYSDGDEPDEDTSIQVTFSEVMSYILHAIITFFNKILRLFRK